MNSSLEYFPIGSVIVADQIFWRAVPWKGLGYLLGKPLRSRIRRHSDPENRSSSDTEHDEREQAFKRQSRHDQKVHGRNVVGVIAQKRLPALRGRPASCQHVLRHRRLRDSEPKLEELAVNARCAPEEILLTHSADQLA